MKIIQCKEVSTVIAEGSGHVGKANVLRFVAEEEMTEKEKNSTIAVGVPVERVHLRGYPMGSEQKMLRSSSLVNEDTADDRIELIVRMDPVHQRFGHECLFRKEFRP